MKDQPSDFGGLSFWQVWDAFGESLIGQRKTGDGPRIVVVGANGAGKTWVAVRLGAALGLPVIHNDALALLRGWVHRPRAEVAAARDARLASPHWVLEGGPSILTPLTLSRATHVVWLDPPRALRIWRILWRTLRYLGQRRPEHPAGNHDWPGPRQWRFLRKVWALDAVYRQNIAEALVQAKVPLIRLQDRAAVSAFLEAAGQRAEGFE